MVLIHSKPVGRRAWDCFLTCLLRALSAMAA
jgi:hypothetical protein